MGKIRTLVMLSAVVAVGACNQESDTSSDSFRSGPLLLMSELTDNDALAGYYDLESDTVRLTAETRDLFADEGVTFVNADGDSFTMAELSLDVSDHFPEGQAIEVVNDGQVVGTLVRESADWFDGLTESEAESNFIIIIEDICL